MTLDKLPAIRGDLVRIDPSWESWHLSKLSKAVRLWTRRNPADTNQREQTEQQTAKQNLRQQARIYHTRRGSDLKPHCWPCVYCSKDHKAVECTKVTDVSDRRQILLNKRLCFNCTAGNHPPSIVPANPPVNNAASVTTRPFVGHPGKKLISQHLREGLP